MIDRSDMDASESPRVSVVIVSWNALETVKRCLPSVTRTDYPNLEILFADNGSDDGTSDYVAAAHPEVILVRHPENWAFCKGNNAAVSRTTGEFIVLLNNDVEVPADWLRPLVDRLVSDPTIGAVQPKVLSHSDHSRFEYAGAAGGFMDRNGYPFARGRLFFTLEEDRGQYDAPADVFWATGAVMATRKGVYEKLGGLDERLHMHMEEIDYCWRLLRDGYRVMCDPAGAVYHIGGASLAAGSPHKAFLNYRNNLLVLFKNLPPRVWRRVIFRRICLDGLGVLRALVLLQFGEALAILRAYLAAHRMKKDFTGDRPMESEHSVLPPYRGNIVFDYFLRGRKHFSDLPRVRFRQ